MAQGKIYGQSGGETKSFAVTFTTIPDNCTVIVKDANQKVIEPTVPKIYKLKAGLYTYSVSCEGYFSLEDQSLSVLQDTVIEVPKLSKKLYVTFVLNPTNATLEVKDGEGHVLVAQEDHTYEVKAGMYSYSCSAENYQTITDQAFEMTEDEERKTIDINLIDASVYGVRIKIGASTTNWERINNNAGKTAEDLKNISPWKDIKSCDMSPDGTINAWIGDPTYNAKSPKGYIMTYFPEFYYKREQPRRWI